MTFRSTPSLEAPRGRGSAGRVVALALFGVLPAGSARAEVPLDLAWEAPAGCPQAEDVRAHIREIAGDALRGMSRLRAVGKITRASRRYQLTLEVDEGGATRERSIDSDSCASLAGAAAVTLGLLLRSASGETGQSLDRGRVPAGTADEDPATHGDAGPAALGSGAPRTEPSRTGTSTELAAVHDARSSSADNVRRWHVFLRAPLLAADTGRMPSPSIGGGLGLGFEYDRWRFAADARIFRKRSLWSREFPEVGVAVSPTTLSLSACRGFRHARWELGPCLWLGLERWQLEGRGPNVVPRERTVMSFVAGAGGAAHLYLSDWLALTGGLALGVASERPRIVLDGLGEIRQLGAVKLDLTLGAEWIF